MESFKHGLYDESHKVCIDETDVFNIITSNDNGTPSKSNLISNIIGSGSYGYVYKVYFTDYGLRLLRKYFIQKRIYDITIDDNPRETPVAIKMFAKERHFYAERNIALRIPRDPCLPLYFGCIQTEANRYFIMYNYIKGSTLSEHAFIDRRFSSETYGNVYDKRIQIGTKLINVMKLLHSHGIYHRDIKPNNIIVVNTLKDNIFNPVLIDFGLATTVDILKQSKTNNHSSNPLLNNLGNFNKLQNNAGTGLYMNPYLLCLKHNPNTIYEPPTTHYTLLGKNGAGLLQYKKYYNSQTYQTFLEKNDYWAMAITLYVYYTTKLPPFILYTNNRKCATRVVKTDRKGKFVLNGRIVEEQLYDLYVPPDTFKDIPNDMHAFFRIVFSLDFFDNERIHNDTGVTKLKHIYPEKFIDQKLHMNRKFYSKIVDPFTAKNKEFKKLYINNIPINALRTTH